MVSDDERAAGEWLALVVALGLDELATAQGVVTEIANLRRAAGIVAPEPGLCYDGCLPEERVYVG